MIPATSALKAQIDQSARNLVAFLDENKTAKIFRFPHSFSFPTNCCEGTSLIFKYLLEDKYGLSRALIVHGMNRKAQHHFWVDLDGLVYDLTAHQFAPRKNPIIGEPGTPFEKKFPEISIKPDDPEFLDKAAVIDLHRAGIFNF